MTPEELIIQLRELDPQPCKNRRRAMGYRICQIEMILALANHVGTPLPAATRRLMENLNTRLSLSGDPAGLPAREADRLVSEFLGRLLLTSAQSLLP